MTLKQIAGNAISNILIMAGSLVSLATGLAFLNEQGWIWEMLSHFRWQYFVLLTLVVFALIGFKRYRVAIIFTVFVMINSAFILPFIFKSGDCHGVSQNNQYRVVHINVNNRNTQYNRVIKFVWKSNPDILLLQEVDRIWLKKMKELEDQYPYCRYCLKEGVFGIALYSKIPFEKSGTIIKGSLDIPSLYAEMILAGRRIYFFGTHPVPPITPVYAQFRNQQLSAVAEHLSTISYPVLLVGDLNITPWTKAFYGLIKTTGLKNSAKGFGVQPTWPTNYFPMRIPIDHCLVSEEFRILSRKTGPHIGSDHFPVIVDFTVEEHCKKAGVFRDVDR
ncbi:endonuclease/exonuclease/phosphatase family protein [bacterium]|nr:endonuclease/exonuclease/phosphatase family protein [bacterium]